MIGTCLKFCDCRTHKFQIKSTLILSMIELNFYVKFNLILHVINYIHCCFFVLFFDRPIKCIELLKSHQIVTSLIPINGVVNKNCMLPNCCLLGLNFNYSVFSEKSNVETAVN